MASQIFLKSTVLCYGQGETIDELITNIKEVIALCLEEEGDRLTYRGSA